MRYRKRRKFIPGRLFGLLSALILFAICVATFFSNRTLMADAGRWIAIVSAAVTMPDESIIIIKDRFRAEIYGDEDLPGEPPETRPIPRVPSKQANPEASQGKSDGDGESSNSKTARVPRIPSEYAAPLLSEDFSGYSGGTLIEHEAGYIRNDTWYDAEDLGEILKKPPNLQFFSGNEPQVLIIHTHATEAFEKYDTDRYDIRNTWRSTDNKQNMVAVGAALEEVLEGYGIGVIHDTTQHDYPSYNGSYERSAATIREYLKEYPGIKIVLDLHRDAMQRDDAIVKPVTVIDGRKAAQVMIIAGCDDGSMNMSEWRQNLRFAASFQSYMEQGFPGLTRPVFLCYRKYNMDLTPGSLLLEFGSNANTLDEAVYAAEMAGHALAAFIMERTGMVE